MALENSSGYPTGDLIFLSPRSKDKEKKEIEKPYFEVAKKDEKGKIQKCPETYTDLKNVNLTKIEFKNREYNKAVSQHVVFYFQDSSAKETYYLDLTYRMSTRGLFNSLLSLDSFNNLSIGIYRSKKGFESFSLKQNDEKTDWKFKLEDLPEVPIVTLRGQKIKDYSPVDNFFAEHLKEIAAKINGSKAPESKVDTETKTSGTAKTNKETVEENSSDVPF